MTDQKAMKRKSPSIQKFLSYTLLCTALTLGFEARIIAQSEKTKQQGSSASTQATSTSVWSWETAAKIKLTQSNVAPKIETFVNLAPEANIWVWDSWVLRNRDSSLAQVDGYYVLFSLVAPRVLAPEERHNQARIGYWYSKNGRDWTFAGEAFPQEEGLGSRQWSGGDTL